MKKQRIIGFITILAGLPAVGGLWLIGQLESFPPTATIIVINAIVFRAICGTVGGILIWRGSRWGYYLTLACWIYLILVSLLTLIQLYDNGIVISYGFLEQNYSSFGRPFLLSVLKIVFGIPIVHVVINSLFRARKIGS